MEDYFGLTKNMCFFTGRVVGEPEVIDADGGRVAFFDFKTYVREQQGNGQWVDSEQIVPMMVLDDSKVNVVEKYVNDGKQLQLEAYYKAWEVEGDVQHALVVTKLDLGMNKFVPREGGAGPRKTPPRG